MRQLLRSVRRLHIFADSSISTRLFLSPLSGLTLTYCFLPQVIDTLALHLPKKQVYPPIAAFAKQAIQSPDPLFREAAVTSLGVIAEGCAEVMRKRLKELLPVILAGLRDGDKEVRGQSAFALGLFAESLQPEMVEHYEQVLPPVFDLLKDLDDEVQVRTF